jgi:hypothetical protein
MMTKVEFALPTVDLLGTVEGHTIGGGTSSVEVGAFVNVPRTGTGGEKTLTASETGAPSNPD